MLNLAGIPIVGGIPEADGVFRRLVESIVDDAIILLDPCGRITGWNRGAQRIYGYTESQILGEPLSLLFTQDGQRNREPMHALRAASLTGRWEDEGWRVRDNGEFFWASSGVTAVCDDTGTLLGFAVLDRDLTAYQARVALQSESHARCEFLALMSHELRTPLNAIIGYTEILEEGLSGPLTPKQRHQLGRIEAGARHLSAIIDEILLFTRIEAGEESVHPTAVNVATLIREAVACTRPEAVTKGLELRSCGFPPALPAITDSAKLRQLLGDLLSNAVKYTARGVVEVRARQRGNMLVIRVRDTGPGIPRDKMGSIFEPFAQGARTSTRTHSGTGLGLTLAHRFARMLGGSLAVNSVMGKGSVFRLRLPAALAASTPALPT